MEHETYVLVDCPGDITVEVVVRKDPQTDQVIVSVQVTDGGGHIVVVDDIHSVLNPTLSDQNLEVKIKTA